MFRTLIVAAIVSLAALAGQAQARVRQYYIAADEVEWNYMPSGQDGMMGMAPMGYAKFYATHDAHLIGPVYKKAIYREYTDATFKTLKPRPASQPTSASSARFFTPRSAIRSRCGSATTPAG